MGARSISLVIEKQGARVQLSAAYRYFWWLFERVLNSFSVPLSPPLATYRAAYTSLPTQQSYLNGQRPYNAHRFVYHFPVSAGNDWVAVELTYHWFRLALALWESEHANYLARYGVGLQSPLPRIADVVYEGRFLVLRSDTWIVAGRPNQPPTLYRQADRTTEAAAFDMFDESEQAAIEQLLATGVCQCPLCALLAPDVPAQYAWQAQLQTDPLPYTIAARQGWRIASLVDPTPSLLRMLLAATPVLAADSRVAYAEQFNVCKAFYLLCERMPQAFAIVREGLQSDQVWTRAVALCGLQAQLVAGREQYRDWRETFEAALVASLPEATCAVHMLLRSAPPLAWRAALTARILEALRRFATPAWPNGIIIGYALRLWQHWYTAAELPPAVAVYCRDFLHITPANHLAAPVARALLALTESAS